MDRYRRGIYTVWRRSAPYPSFVTFDAPDRGACVVNRSRTNTPLQALNLLNDQTYVEMGLALSERILRDEPSSDPAARIDYAFRLCLARLPTDRERQFLTAVVREERSAFRKNPGLAAELVNSWKSARDLPAEEVATWYRIAEVLLNLDESITRS